MRCIACGEAAVNLSYSNQLCEECSDMVVGSGGGDDFDAPYPLVTGDMTEGMTRSAGDAGNTTRSSEAFDPTDWYENPVKSSRCSNCGKYLDDHLLFEGDLPQCQRSKSARS